MKKEENNQIKFITNYLSKQLKSFELFIQNLPKEFSNYIKPYEPNIAKLIESIIIDSPLILSICLFCLLIQLTSLLFGYYLINNYFSIPSLSNFYIYSPICYFRMISHVFGHTSWEHLNSNITHLLLVGPNCEREYGIYKITLIVFFTALSSSIVHILFGPNNTIQLGASGIVFMFILLNSLIETKTTRIPMTFICQVGIWCYREIIGHFLNSDGVSHLAHITGAVVGIISGYYLHHQREKEMVNKYVKVWLDKLK